MKRRTRHDDADQEGWTSGGDLADVEETPRSSRGEVPAVNPLPSPLYKLILTGTDIRSS